MAKRKVNVFEWILLPVGFIIAALGLWLIQRELIITGYRIGWEVFSAVFLWLILIFLIIITAVNENQKEELSVVIKEHAEETRLLKKIIQDQLEEMKMLRKEIKK
ncbi:hypothetical protein D6745_05635 [Candidatus Woesearchaeota archaeon]|nr:MAG: hypothetical protein D6745_05635 [Candidatus Woesearchaeota archaeon]